MGEAAGASFSPFVKLVLTCVTPELEYLQAKGVAHLSYAAATTLLGEILPIADAISVSGTKRRVRAIGASLDQSVGQPVGAGVKLTPRLPILRDPARVP